MKYRHRKFLALGASAVLALGGLAACGDDEESDAAGASSALSESELAAEVAPVCKEHDEAISAAVEEEFAEEGPTPVAIRAAVKDAVLPHLTAQIGQLEALEPPEELAADYEQWLADQAVLRDAIKDDPNLAFDPSASEFATVNDEAEALGLDCSVGPQAGN